MSILEALWNYCRRPKKHTSAFFARLTTQPRFFKFVISSHLFILARVLISLVVSLSLLYSVMVIIMGVTDMGASNIGVLINPILWSILFGLWCVFDFFLDRIGKRWRKASLFIMMSLIVLSPGIVAGLNLGVFDSLDLSRDSVIDLYYCTAWFNITNKGLTDVKISKVQIGDFIFDVSIQYSYQWMYDLKRRESATLAIYYAHGKFTWGGMLGDDPNYAYYAFTEFDSNLEITPTTFEEGKYPVIIYTDGMIPYKFEVEARYSLVEEIYGFQTSITNLGEGRVGDQNHCLPDIWFTFNMSSHSIAYIYSVKIENLTINLNPPLLIRGKEYFNCFYMYFHVSVNEIYVSVLGTTSAILNQPLNVPIFKVGETYNVTVRTMANNNYTTSITMIK